MDESTRISWEEKSFVGVGWDIAACCLQRLLMVSAGKLRLLAYRFERSNDRYELVLADNKRVGLTGSA